MRTLTAVALVAMLHVLTAPVARAELGALDDVPAATLLLPYFEVLADDPLWQTTLFSINNASPEPAIAHVTLWTDLSVPTLDFNVYLTGYDVTTFNLGSLFGSGFLPATDAAGIVSPVGPKSSPTSSNPDFAPSPSCDAQLPLPPLPAVLLAHIRAAHTGQPSPIFGGLCSGQDFGDGVARGYITIDSVNFCSLEFPGSAGYFIDGGIGVANNANVLWGDTFYADAVNGLAHGDNLVHIEADPSLGAGDYTFYARYSGGVDNREALATTFATRYADFGPGGGTRLMVWRDSKFAVTPFACGGAPPWFPLGANQIVIFDEQENPVQPPTSPFSPAIPGQTITPFPAESSCAEVGTDLPTPFDAGWLYLNLNTSTGGLASFDPLTQNWVGTQLRSGMNFSVAYDAIVLGTVQGGDDAIIPPP